MRMLKGVSNKSGMDDTATLFCLLFSCQQHPPDIPVRQLVLATSSQLVLIHVRVGSLSDLSTTFGTPTLRHPPLTSRLYLDKQAHARDGQHHSPSLERHFALALHLLVSNSSEQ